MCPFLSMPGYVDHCQVAGRLGDWQVLWVRNKNNCEDKMSVQYSKVSLVFLIQYF